MISERGSFVNGQKAMRINIFEKCLYCFMDTTIDFTHRFLTANETCVHHYTPKIRQKPKQWAPSWH